MENQDVNSIDDTSNENNTLPDDLFEEVSLEENQQPTPESHIADSSPENTTIEETQPPAGQEEDIPDKENPDSYKYWQGEADKRKAELESFKNQYAQDKQAWDNAQREIASVKEQLNPPVEPVLPPELRDSYDDPLDEVKDLKENLRYVLKETQGMRQESAQEKQVRKNQEEAARFKAYSLGELQKQPGYDLEKANRALEWYGKSRTSPEEYYKDIAMVYSIIEGQAPNNREQEIQQRVNRQGETLPLGVKTSETETKKKSDDIEFFDDMNTENFGNY